MYMPQLDMINEDIEQKEFECEANPYTSRDIKITEFEIDDNDNEMASPNQLFKSPLDKRNGDSPSRRPQKKDSSISGAPSSNSSSKSPLRHV